VSWLISQALMDCVNSLSSPEPGAEFSAGTSWDGEPSAPSSGSPTQQAYLSHGKTTAFSRPSRFGMTFKPLTDARGEDVLMSYLAAFPVRTSQLPEKAQGLTGSAAGCGRTWLGSLGKYDPDSRSWKTAQRSFLGDLEESLETWPRSGMTVAGECWELPMLERRTSATDSGLWLPTPVSIDAGSGRVNTSIGSSNQRPTLALMARKNLWPTPTCGMASHAQLTPEASQREMDRSIRVRGNPSSLAIAIQAKYPTPTVNDSKNSTLPESQRNRDGLAGSLLRSGERPGGQLNPTWVEWLMGWPLNWTSLGALSNDNFKQWQESGAEADSNVGVRSMWWDCDPSEAPQRPKPDEQRAGQPGGAVPSLPQGGSHGGWDMGAREGRASDLQVLRIGVSASENSPCDGLLVGMSERAGPNLCDEAVVPRVATGVVARVDRLKAIGNGQVPQCAAAAWRLLTA
jgi:hypothetical protein